MERTPTHASPSARVPTPHLLKTPKHPSFRPSVSSSSSSSPSSPSSPPIQKWTGRMKRGTMTWTHWIQTLFPCYLWMRSYKWREYLRPDLVAGVSVAVMLVPQSMSYAKQAGLHPIYGLYSGFVPVLAYAIFGSSRHVSIGPISMISLLVSNALGRIAGSSSEDAHLYTELAILLALMVGILECAMGLLRLGWLIRFVSHSVISGYTTATAVVIAVSQLSYFLGYALERSGDIVPLVRSIVAGADKFSWPPFVMGSILLAILIIMKHLGNSSKNLRFLRASGPLTAVVLSTIFVKIFHPPAIELIDRIPQGLPRFSVPKGFAYVKSLIPVTVMITGVAILESIAIAKALAAKYGYEVDTNQELFGLGVANIAGSFFQVYPVTGAFSRSAVNHESEAKTGLSGIVTGIIMGCALLFMTPLFEYIPECALAAIVISAVIGLIDYKEAIYLWRVDKKQFLVWFITCAVALFLGVEIGVLVGVGTSLILVIQESANPRIAVLGRLPGTTAFRNIEHYSEAYTYNGIAIVRIDSPIYFANSSCIMDRLREYEAEAEENAKRIHFVIIEMTPVSYIDGHAAQAFKELYHEYESRNMQIAISNPSREVQSMLTRSGAVDLIGREWLFDRTHDAVEACLRHVQKSNGSPKTQSTYDDDDDDDSSLSLLERGFEDNDDDITSHLEKPLLSWGN